MRCEKIEAPLSPLFEGRFKVISRKSKYFVKQKQENIDCLTIDRPKPAHLDNEPPFVFLYRLHDKTITESTSKNEKSAQVAEKVLWSQPISQTRISTV